MKRTKLKKMEEEKWEQINKERKYKKKGKNTTEEYKPIKKNYTNYKKDEDLKNKMENKIERMKDKKKKDRKSYR